MTDKITSEYLEKVAHISSEEVLQDIKDTEVEVESFKKVIRNAEDGIREREVFVRHLRDLLIVRYLKERKETQDANE